nr:hypothetical protein CFP56_03191 [Quercus suber]
MSALVSGMDLTLCMANRLQAYLAYYICLPPALTTDNLRKALVTLYAHILRFLAKAIRLGSMNAAALKAHAFWQDSELIAFETESDKLGESVEIEARNCDRELNKREQAAAAQWRKKLAASLRKIDSIQSITESLDVLLMKSDLSKLSVVREAIYNSSTKDKMSMCLDGTRSEILHNIQQWVDGPDGKPIFWLCGKAGTGKSTISRTVAQKFDKPQGSDKQRRLGASFFFKRGEQNRGNTSLFFSTVAAQIADLIPQLREPISAAHDTDSFLCSRGLQEQFEKLLLQPLLSLDPAFLPRRKVLIVIDALDECDRSTDIRLFLRLLAQIEATNTLQLCIFLTSRPELPIQLGFRQLDGSLYQDIVLEVVQENSIRRDLRAYFDAEFAKIRQDRDDDILLKNWPSEADLKTLVDLAIPLFIFASTICRFVAEMKPRKRLESVLAQRYTTVSSHLAKTYAPVLNHLLEGKLRVEQDEIIRDFRKIVGPIILAAEPLSVASLAGLLCIHPQNINEEICDLLERLHSVLDIPPDLSNPVRLLHLSFRDFLTDEKREDQEEFWIDEIRTHKELVHCCLRRLGKDGALQSDICRVVQPGTKRFELSPQQIRTQIPPDIAYACSYWPLHFLRSKETLLDDGPVHHFLQQHFLHWLETLSWLDRLSSVITYINNLLLIAQVRQVNIYRTVQQD